MKKSIFLFLTLGLIALKSFSQEAFVLGKTYRQGWIVWFPDNKPENYYMSIPISFTAKITPDKDPLNWKRPDPKAPAPTPTTPTTNTAPKVAVDSVQLKFNDIERRLKLIEKQWLIFGNGFDIKQTDTATIVNLKPIK